MTPNALGGVWSSTAIRRFALHAGFVLVTFTTVAVVGIYLRTEHLVISGVRQQASSCLDLIVTARAWNARHGGVWVEKTLDAPTNEYLTDLGVIPDTSTVSGVTLTLRNPAAMTRELSELVARRGRVAFRLTSLEAVNPRNRPDAWEARHLRAFELGEPVAETIATVGGRRVYRMMRPLFTERSCLRCHGVSGYEVGDVRGALSVSVDLAETDAELRRNALGLAVLWTVVVAGLGFVLFGLVLRMARRIERGESRLRHLATTDTLTGLPNRRTTMERLVAEHARGRRESLPVGIIVADIDHFKAVNDTFGHAAGDATLTAVAGTMRAALRPYDIVGRIGGEEFLVVAPDVDVQGVRALAERLRETVEASRIPVPSGATIHVTVSAGCAIDTGGDDTPDRLLVRADDALYRAKEAGRNRVEMG